jgi:hypothetical protein
MAADTTHPCPGCDAPGVPKHQLSCRPCWFRLDRVIRDRISRAYRAMRQYPHDGDYQAAHRRALADALEWYKTNPAVSRG